MIQAVTFLGWWVHVTRTQGVKLRDLQRSGMKFGHNFESPGNCLKNLGEHFPFCSIRMVASLVPLVVMVHKAPFIWKSLPSRWKRPWSRGVCSQRRGVCRARWFKVVTFSSPSWRSLNSLKGSLNDPKKVTLNHQVRSFFFLGSRIFEGIFFKNNGGNCERLVGMKGLGYY